MLLLSPANRERHLARRTGIAPLLLGDPLLGGLLPDFRGEVPLLPDLGDRFGRICRVDVVLDLLAGRVHRFKLKGGHKIRAPPGAVRAWMSERVRTFPPGRLFVLSTNQTRTRPLDCSRDILAPMPAGFQNFTPLHFLILAGFGAITTTLILIRRRLPV